MNSNFDGFLTKIPIVTLYFTVTLIFTTALVSFRALNPKYIILNWLFVYKNRHIWRIFTNYFFIGSFSINWIMSLVVFVQFSTSLEHNMAFARSKGSYLYFLFLQMVTISTLSLLFYWPIGTTVLTQVIQSFLNRCTFP